MKLAGKMSLAQFYAWLNPEGMSIDDRYRRDRLLAEYAEITEEVYWHFLEMLPPMYFSNSGFAICEATTEDVRLGFFRMNGRHYAAHVSDCDKAHTMAATRAMIAAVQS